MKHYFIAVLVAVLSCSFVDAKDASDVVTNKTDRDNSSEPKKRLRALRVLSAWEQYQTYTIPAGFLSNMGFVKKATCAVSLMKSVSFQDVNFEDLLSTNALMKERSKVFEAVIEDGIAILRSDMNHSELSDQALREVVYQNLMQTEANLHATINMLKIAVNSQTDNENDKSIVGLANAGDFESIYFDTNCASILQYDLTK